MSFQFQLKDHDFIVKVSTIYCNKRIINICQCHSSGCPQSLARSRYPQPSDRSTGHSNHEAGHPCRYAHTLAIGAQRHTITTSEFPNQPSQHESLCRVGEVVPGRHIGRSAQGHRVLQVLTFNQLTLDTPVTSGRTSGLTAKSPCE